MQEQAASPGSRGALKAVGYVPGMLNEPPKPATVLPTGLPRLLGTLCFTILFLAVAFLIPACKQSEVRSAEENDPGRDVLRYDVYLPFSSLDPANPACDGFSMVMPFIFSYLFIANEEWQPEPDLATSWSYDPDTFTWTIHIREDVLFHDGRHLTASDVKYSLETVLKVHNPAAHGVINHIDALNESTLNIRLNQDDPDFIRKIWAVEIIPRKSDHSASSGMHPIGSGSFRFGYIKGQEEIMLVANDRYYRGIPSLKKVLFYFIPNPETSWVRLLTGKTDLAFNIDPKDFEMMAPYQDRFYFNMTIEPFRTLLLFNTKDSLLEDQRVRLALSYAVNKEYMVNTILGGQGTVAIGTMGYNSPFRNPELQPIPFDPQRSLELLREAGWTHDSEGYLLKEGRHLEFTILFHQEVQSHERVAQYLRLCFSKLGVKTSLQAVLHDELVHRFHGNDAFQSVLTSYKETKSEDMLEQSWALVDGKPALAGNFQDTQVTKLIREALRAKDPFIRKSLFHKIDSLLTSLQPAVFFYQKRSLNVLSKRFRPDFSFDSSIFARFRLWSLSPTIK